MASGVSSDLVTSTLEWMIEVAMFLFTEQKRDNFPRGKGNVYRERNFERGANRYRKKKKTIKV